MKVMDLLVMGNKQRTSEPTAANKTSSRSHAILQVRVKRFFGLLEGTICQGLSRWILQSVPALFYLLV